MLCASESLHVLVPLLHSSELHSRHRSGGGAIVVLAEVRAVFEWAAEHASHVPLTTRVGWYDAVAVNVDYL